MRRNSIECRYDNERVLGYSQQEFAYTWMGWLSLADRLALLLTRHELTIL
jgi:hypothetical protein